MSLPLADPQSVGLSPERCARLGEVLRAEVARGRMPGAVALVARHGRVALVESVGVLDPAHGDPMTVDAIFRLYSMTKPIVSVAALMLMEQGRFLLADPVEKHLPEFAGQQVAVERGGEVVLEPVRQPATVQDLMRHTAGLSYEFAGDGPVQRYYREHGLDSPQPGRDNAAYSRALARAPLLFHPGTEAEYSRATDVLGRLVEVWSGQPLGSFLRQHILEPLGMRDTGFWVPPAQQHRIAEPFAHDPEGGVPLRMRDVRVPPAMESGGGGLVGTAMDYARFAQMLLDGGSFAGQRLLGPRTVDYLRADHLGRIPARATLLDPGEGFGLGVAVRLATGVTQVPGSPGTFYWSGMGGTSFFVDPVEQLVGVLMVLAPNQRGWYRQLFRNLVYAAIVE